MVSSYVWATHDAEGYDVSPHYCRSRKGRRHHERWRVLLRVQQNLSFVIIPLRHFSRIRRVVDSIRINRILPTPNASRAC